MGYDEQIDTVGREVNSLLRAYVRGACGRIHRRPSAVKTTRSEFYRHAAWLGIGDAGLSEIANALRPVAEFHAREWLEGWIAAKGPESSWATRYEDDTSAAEVTP